MVPIPVALGLTPCDLVIVEQGTLKVSLLGTFTKLEVDSFPSAPRPFFVFTALSGTVGSGTITLALTRLDTDEEIGTESVPVQFTERFDEVSVIFRIEEWSFPVPGWYGLKLSADGEWVAQKRLEVYAQEKEES